MSAFEITRTAEWVAPLDEGARVAMDVETQAEFEQGIHPDVRAVYDGPCDVVLLAVPAGQGVVVQTALRRFLNVEQFVPLPCDQSELEAERTCANPEETR